MKKLISIILSLSLLLTLNISVNALDIDLLGSATTDEYVSFVSSLIPNEVKSYINKNEKTISEAIIINNDINNIKCDSFKLLNNKIFVIYDLNSQPQNELYYLPVIAEDNIIDTVSIVNTNLGYSFSVSNEYSEELDSIDYDNKDYIFYMSKNNLVADNGVSQKAIKGIIDSQAIDFLKKPIYEKLAFICNKKQQLQETNLNDNNCVKFGYTRGFSKNEDGWKELKLYKKKSQGNYNLCWAASAATTINYINGTNITAKKIADDLEIPYNSGAPMSTVKTALSNNSISYTKTGGNITYSAVKKNINKKYPAILGSKNSNLSMGHIVTLVGYHTFKTNEYAIIWNSGITNSNNKVVGGYQTLYYNPNGMTFNYANITWTTFKYLSKYN